MLVVPQLYFDLHVSRKLYRYILDLCLKVFRTQILSRCSKTEDDLLTTRTCNVIFIRLGTVTSMAVITLCVCVFSSSEFSGSFELE